MKLTRFALGLAFAFASGLFLSALTYNAYAQSTQPALNKDIAQDTRDIKTDKTDLKQAVQSGDKSQVKKDKKDLKKDKKDRKKDKRQKKNIRKAGSLS